MRVLHNRVYLDMPRIPESKIELDPGTKLEIKKEVAAKFDRMRVFAIGEDVQSMSGVAIQGELALKVGDEVFVDPRTVSGATIIPTEHGEKIAVPYNAIYHIW